MDVKATIPLAVARFGIAPRWGFCYLHFMDGLQRLLSGAMWVTNCPRRHDCMPEAKEAVKSDLGEVGLSAHNARLVPGKPQQ